MHVDEMIRLRRRGKPPEDSAICNHMTKLGKIGDEELVSSIAAWVANVNRAVGNSDLAKLKQLQEVVEKKARKLEDRDAAAAAKAWRSAPSKRNETKHSAHGKSLSKLAYMGQRECGLGPRHCWQLHLGRGCARR